MDSLALETQYVPHLRGQFANGSAVLFLGAGFSLEAKTIAGTDILSAEQLTKELWSLCFPSDPFDNTTQLQDIFEIAQTLKPKELTYFLRKSFTVDPDSCPSWYESLLSMPWLRIYTLNIDDLVSKVLSTTTGSRRVRTVSATTEPNPIFDDSQLSVVHLNGTLEDIPNNVTFARSQYAQRLTTDTAYAQLKNDLLFRSVIFVGTSMEEGPFWQHLELRGQRAPRGQRELRPRSYLVVPALNRSKEALLTRYNIVWLPMSGESLYNDVLARMSEERALGHEALRRISVTDSTNRFSRVSDLAATSKAGGEEYLLGAEPTWADARGNRVAHRACFDDFWEHLQEIRSSPAPARFIVLTGTAGTGKSSALMATALRCEADGVSVAWLDSDQYFSRRNFRQALSSGSNIGAIFINDADIYDIRLSSMVRDALEYNPQMLVVSEVRSSKVDRVINKHELGDIQPIEYTVPPLADNDIEGILDVLDREHRLGRLKGMDREERRHVFQSLAGRQLLVAMHIATHGKDFEERARDELRDLQDFSRFMYGIICVASAHRFSLRQEDIGIACSDDGTEWLQTLDALIRRKLILPHKNNSFRARHRVVAQLVYDLLVEEGRLHGVARALLRVAASRTTPLSSRTSLHARMLRTFLNHNHMKRFVGLEQGREIYSEFEDALSWDYHFWLHRGALELETDNLDRAENFLAQAKAIEENDVFIDNELAYLSFKKAIAHPEHVESRELIDEAIATLNDIADRRTDQLPHAFHIMGQQGLSWSRIGIQSAEEKSDFLKYLQKKVARGLQQEPSEIMRNLADDLKRELLMIAAER